MAEANSSNDVLPARVGRFEVQSLLGEGAFGRVYLAFDAELERQVAIKVPRLEGLTPEHRERFLREARATAKIHHPNVCPVYEVGTDGELPFIVMHFAPGSTLAAYLDEYKTITPLQAAALTQRLALGMAAAHEKNVIHRDLKPQNILFDPQRQVALITDFGLARIGNKASSATLVGSVFGTPAYMSPEQARGDADAVSPLSDVYSLGIIFYRMLTGTVPFHGTVYEVLLQHTETQPPPPSSIRPGLDPRLDSICLKALAKLPSERYPSAKAFADTLGDYLRSTESTGWFATDETHAPAARQQESAGKYRKPAPPPLPGAAVATSETLPIPTDDDQGGAVRQKVLIGGIILLFVLITGVIGYLVATRERTPVVESNPPPPRTTDRPETPKDPPPIDQPDYAAERRAATWVLALGGAVDITTKDGETRHANNADELPDEFTVARLELRAHPEITDESVRSKLIDLSGPLTIRFHECRLLTDEIFKLLAALPKLTSLTLSKMPNITDSGLAVLADHPALSDLTLLATAVTKEGVKQIAKLPHLTRLHIDVDEPTTWLEYLAPLTNLTDLTLYARDRAELNDSGLTHIKAFQKLTRLSLIGRNVTDEWLPKLAEFESLVQLDLVNARVFGDGLVHLKKLTRLRSLDLEDSLIRDQALAHLAEFPALEELNLKGTEISDAGARLLAKAGKLRKLILTKTNVSAKTVRFLELELQGCKIIASME